MGVGKPATAAPGTATAQEGVEARPPARERRLGPTGRSLILCGLGAVAGLTLVVIVHVALSGVDSHVSALRSRALPAELAIQQTSLATLRAQETFLTAASTQDPSTRAMLISTAERAGQDQVGSWEVYRRHALALPGERPLQSAFEASMTRSRTLGARLILTPLGDGSDYAADLADEQRESQIQQATLDSLNGLYAARLASDAASIGSGVNTTRTATLAAYGVSVVVFAVVALLFLKRARRDERAMVDEAAALRTSAERAELEASLQRGLEMEPTEDATIGIIGRALTMVAPGVPVEMLLADSSQAHFSQVLSSHPEGKGCHTPSPNECPAARAGQSLVFADSSRLDTCPYLRGQSPTAWATCVPVSVAGHPVGVIHARRALDTVRPAGLTASLELVARKAGERISVMRVLARTEAQARVDPLTGLPNRRTLEDQVHEVLGEDTPFVVAFADLDHFKDINDLHGHDAGDRALRVFARVLRDSIRPNDLYARYGGEEFVVVLPDCSLADAHAACDRLRAELQRVLGQAAVPHYTVTIGLAAADPGEPFFEVLARADGAMLKGKAMGRDRTFSVYEDLDDAAATPPAQPKPSEEDSA